MLANILGWTLVVTCGLLIAVQVGFFMLILL
jgi:hypothetical protein